MKEVKTFYQSRIERYEQELKKVKEKSFLLSMLRLTVFLAMALLIYFFLSNSIVLVSAILGGVVAFLILVRLSVETTSRKEFLKTIIQLNQTEVKFLEGDIEGLESGEEYKDGEHHFAADIDLFGSGSLFQRLNRTPRISSRNKLAALMVSNDIERIEEKQQFIQELAEMGDWRQEFETHSVLIKSDVEPSTIATWLENYKSFVPKLFAYLPTIFTILSATVIGLYAFSIVGGTVLLGQLLLGLFITGMYLKKINLLSGRISQAKETLRQFSHSLRMIEDQTFSSAMGNELKKRIEQDEKKASKIFQELTSEIDSLDQRSNILLVPILDGFGLWQLRYSYRIEKWIAHFEQAVDEWFDVIDTVHAYNSMANFAFNHPDFTYPELQEGTVIRAEGLGHPTLSREARVDNDVTISEQEFYIVTGANMAGKSTFLRTIGVSIVSANCGLPICAKTFSYGPIKLISSMRTTDSLHKNESYFYSELKRLQFVTQEIAKDRYLIILDEILKGTNSADKEEGSRKFVEKLVQSKSTGIIATHDLSLCDLAKEHSSISNYYFDAKIAGNDLSFDYQLKKGICQNMNASFLMKQMGIV